MRRKIYVASSWRNDYYPKVVAKLREAGHEVYDFRNPPSDSKTNPSDTKQVGMDDNGMSRYMENNDEEGWD